MLKALHHRAIDDHLFREAGIHAFLLVHVKFFRLEILDTVIKALRAGIEKEAG